MLPAPLLYLSAFFEATREEYYARLLGVTQSADWDGWLRYFLRGMARMSEDVLERAQHINQRLGMAFTTAQRAIAALERGSVLERIAGDRRGRVYCAGALLKVLEGPARLWPPGSLSAGVLRFLGTALRFSDDARWIGRAYLGVSPCQPITPTSAWKPGSTSIGVSGSCSALTSRSSTG